MPDTVEDVAKVLFEWITGYPFNSGTETIDCEHLKDSLKILSQCFGIGIDDARNLFHQDPVPDFRDPWDV